MKITKDQVRLTMLASVDLSDEELEDREFEVLHTGEFYDPRYGVFKVTDSMLKDLKKNFDANVLAIDVALDVNHEPDKGAYAWIKELKISEGKLLAKFRDFTEDGKKFFLQKMFRYFSVEFAPFSKVENGKKITIKNVLRGIALTNRPVIKGMSPTFLAEGVNSLTDSSMNTVKLFMEDLLSRDKVSKDDLRVLKQMSAILSEDEKAEIEADVEKVEEKVEAETEDKPEDKPEEKSEEKPAEEKKEEAPAEEKPAEEANLAEVNTKLAEAQKEITALKAAEHKRIVEDRVESVTLSDDNKMGFSASLSKEVTAFVTTLSDKQFNSFSELVKGMVQVDDKKLSEIGHAKTIEKKDDSEDAKLAEAKTLADKYTSEGMLPHLAVEKAQKEVFNK